MASLERDANRVPVAGGVTDDANLTPTALRVDPTTKRLKVTSTTTITGATITDIEDGAGTSIMDAVNSAMQVSIVAGTLTVDATGSGDVPITLDGESVIVTATDLDIRDLTSASDSILMYGSDDGGTTKRVIKTDAGGAIQVDLEAANVTETNSADILTATQGVQTAVEGTLAVDLGLNNDVTLAVLPDTAAGDLAAINSTVSGSLDVSGATVTVDSTNLDIRGLTSASDSVTAEHGITSMGDGVKTVSTAGTDEALQGYTACKKVTVQAQTDNTGLIAIGASGVDATEATGTGILLGAGDAYEFEIDNLADIYIDSTVNGEGVRYTYFN